MALLGGKDADILKHPIIIRFWETGLLALIVNREKIKFENLLYV